MAGCTFVLKGDTETEVKRKISATLKEAEFNRLHEDRRSDISFDPEEKQFFAVLRIHS